MNRFAFTLIETMLAALIMALLTAGVTLNLSGPLAAGRAEDAAAELTAFDAAARQAAVSSGRPVRLAIDMADNTLARFETDPVRLAAKISLPAGYRMDRVKIGRRTESVGLVTIHISPRGWSTSYAARLAGPATSRWYAFAGLTGLSTEASDESALPTPPRTPGYDAD